MKHLILAINPGSTSTKVALFENEREVFKESIDHPQEVIESFAGLLAQIPMRREAVFRTLTTHGYQPEDLAIIIGRGGLFPPIKTGGYRVNVRMLNMILNEEMPAHASNLGAVIAQDMAFMAGSEVKAYIYDGESSGDLPEIATITGLKEVKRQGLCHVLNGRRVAARYSESLGKRYEELNLIVAHLGGGITMSVHEKGKIVDSLSDENGPYFSPERAGTLPSLDLIALCYSGKYTKDELKRKIRGLGGLRDLLGTSDGREIARRVESGDEGAVQAMQALAYQIAKGIGQLAPVLKGHCDGIILTGGLAHNQALIADVKTYVDFMAPIAVMPGEYEMEALALGGLRILRKEEDVHEF
ncbi:MAG: butyrate kinase [Turicibacter sp.]|nr:butyrate kinase [Turicibacter sp.]